MCANSGRLCTALDELQYVVNKLQVFGRDLAGCLHDFYRSEILEKGKQEAVRDLPENLKALLIIDEIPKLYLKMDSKFLMVNLVPRIDYRKCVVTLPSQILDNVEVDNNIERVLVILEKSGKLTFETLVNKPHFMLITEIFSGKLAEALLKLIVEHGTSFDTVEKLDILLEALQLLASTIHAALIIVHNEYPDLEWLKWLSWKQKHK